MQSRINSSLAFKIRLCYTHLLFNQLISPLINCQKIHTFLRCSWWILKFICNRFPKKGYGVGPGGNRLRIHWHFRNCINGRDSTKNTSTSLTVNILLLIYTSTLSLYNCSVDRDPGYLAFVVPPWKEKKLLKLMWLAVFPSLSLLLPHPRELSVLIFKRILHHSIILQLHIYQSFSLQGTQNVG